MPEIPHSEQSETQAWSDATPEAQLEAAFWDTEGFEAFWKIVLPSLPDELQAQLKTVFLANANDGDFKFELDPFNDGFPVDAYSARALIERFPAEDAVATRVETKTSTADTVIVEGNENTEQQAEAVQNIARLRQELSKIGVDIDAELERAGIDLEAEGGVTAFTCFLEQHAARYLDAAKSRSPGGFVAVYDAIEPLAAQSPILAALLQSYERDYQLSRELLRTPNRDLGDIQDAEMALWDSAIIEIDGDIVRGEDGEKLDMSGHQMLLSLEGAGGLELNVWSIDRPDTRAGEISIVQKKQEIATKETEITGLEISAEAYRNLAREFSLENHDNFGTWDAQSGLVRQLLRRFPDLTQLAPLAEATDTGAEFLAVLVQFFEGEAENVDRLITVRRAEIAVLNQEIGILQVQIDAKRRLAAEKIRDQKERVSLTRAFYERLGVSEVLARMRDIFARISPTSPLVLPDGTVVSSINLSTLKITSDRTPGEGGVDDFRAQCVFAEVMNTALCGDQHEPISFTSGGRLAYQRHGKIVDRYDFDAFVSQETDELAFESRVINRLFAWNIRT